MEHFKTCSFETPGYDRGVNKSPPRPPGRPRSETSRAAILDAAFWQVMRRGYAEVTAEAIAKAAGAGKQTLYRWWPSKGRVVLEAFLAKERERIDRPREAAIQAGDLTKFLLAECAGAKPFDAALRFLVAEAQADADLRRAIQTEVVRAAHGGAPRDPAPARRRRGTARTSG